MEPVARGDYRRAYVIDDDRLMRNMVQQLLTEEDILAIGFDSCESFLERHPNRPAGCIILDLCLPGMGGLELLEAISAERAAFPVIVLSGTGSVPSAMRAGQLGVIEFVEKPFRIDQLLSAVNAAFELLRTRELSGVGALQRLTPREKELLVSFGDGDPIRSLPTISGSAYAPSRCTGPHYEEARRAEHDAGGADRQGSRLPVSRYPISAASP